MQEINTTSEERTNTDSIADLFSGGQKLIANQEEFIRAKIEELKHITGTFKEITRLVQQSTEITRELAQLLNQNTYYTRQTTESLSRTTTQQERESLLLLFSRALSHTSKAYASKIDELEVVFTALKSHLNYTKKWTQENPTLSSEGVNKFFGSLEFSVRALSEAISGAVGYRSVLEKINIKGRGLKEGINRTIKAVDRGIYLHQTMRDYYERIMVPARNSLIITNPEDFRQIDTVLTLDFLQNHLLPMFQAVLDLHNSLNLLQGDSPSSIEWKRIQSFSPIVTDLIGLNNLAQTILQYFPKWRRENAQKIAELDIKEKELLVLRADIETKDKRRKSKRDAQKEQQEIRLQELEIARKEAEIEKVNQEIRHTEIRFLVETLKELAPVLPESAKLEMIAPLLRPIHQLAVSPLEISINKQKN